MKPTLKIYIGIDENKKPNELMFTYDNADYGLIDVTSTVDELVFNSPEYLTFRDCHNIANFLTGYLGKTITALEVCALIKTL